MIRRCIVLVGDKARAAHSDKLGVHLPDRLGPCWSGAATLANEGNCGGAAQEATGDNDGEQA